MAKKKATLEVEFERTDDTTKRLPTRAEMTQWMLAALAVPATFACVLWDLKRAMSSIRPTAAKTTPRMS